VCVGQGGPDQVVVEEVPEPVAGPGQVLVDVRAAAVNFPDVLLVAGRYQVPVPTPFTPGSELAGVVAAVGEGVDTVHVGDRVMAVGLMGAFAERAVVPAASVVPVPRAFDDHAAAAFLVTYDTAYHTLRSVAEVQPGEWVVVLGAGGGVGLATLDVARALGARVVAAASTPDKRAVCLERGAEATIAYRDEDLRDRIRDLTGGGADVVVDPVGGPWAERALRAMRWGGRFVVVGFASGEIPSIPLNLVLLKGVIVKGYEARAFGEHAAVEGARDRAELLALAEAGRLRPHIGAVVPLSDVRTALEIVGTGTAIGKVVVDPTA
jgi:NADPH2:quinone reductase